MRNHCSAGTIALILIAAALSGCGTKGPLYIPQPPQAPAAAPGATPQQSPADNSSRPATGTAR